MQSNFYIPKRIIKKVETFLKFTMENGLQQFYRSNAYYLAQFCNKSHPTCFKTTSDGRIEMKELRLIFFIYVILNSLAALTFALELTWFHFKRRRQP